MREMLRRIGVESEQDGKQGVRPATWPWAVASISLVILVACALLLGRRFSLSQVRPTVVGPPALPAINAIAVAHPEAGAQLYALDASAGHLVALAVPREQVCPPVGSCPPAPLPDAFTVLDGASGQQLAATPLTDAAASAASTQALLVDSGRHVAYAVAPGSVTIFSTQDGTRQGGFALPADLSPRVVAVLGGDGLYVTNGTQLFLLDARSGQPLAQANLPSGATSGSLDGPLVDLARARIYLAYAATAHDPPTLLALDARDLHALGQYTLPAGERLGPMDAAGANVYAFSPTGTTAQIALDALAQSSSGLAPLATDATLQNALTLGENAALGHVYVAYATQTRILGGSGALAALPLPGSGAPSGPLLVDSGRDLVYLPASHGALVIARDSSAPTKGVQGVSAESAVILARAAFDTTVGATTLYAGRDRATAQMFPAQPGSRAQSFWVLDPSGWLGPYSGKVSTSIAPTPHSADEDVTFTLDWDQLFPHTHTWTWDVTPLRTAVLVADSGDPVP